MRHDRFGIITDRIPLYTRTDTLLDMPSSIQFGTEQFVAAIGSRAEGIPEHAAMIEGELIHLGVRNLKKWGVTEKATKQIITGIRGIPIRACMNPDPHACDYSSDNFANVGYATGAKVVDGWVVAEAAITDKAAAKKINDKTWMPFGKGSWSVAGFPSDPEPDFETSGLTNGFTPDAIALIIGNGKPAFEGSGFKLVAAAISNYRGNTMAETPEGGNEPVTYTQDALDAAVKTALEKQKTEFDTAGNQRTTEELAKQKLDYDAKIEKLTTEDRAAYDAKIAEMTPTIDVEKMIAAAVTQGQTDTIEAIEKDKLITEYGGMLTASILSSTVMTDGVIDQAKIDAKLAEVRGMKTAAISGMISDAKNIVAAAVPGQNSFNEMQIPGSPPGSEPEGVDQKALDAMGIPSIEFV